MKYHAQGYCRVIIVLLLGFCVTDLSAAVDPVQLESEVLLSRYHELSHTLRCPKCQNQSIAGSDAPIAQDMRDRVVALLKEGKTNQEIEAFMIQRYGDFVTYNTPLKARTYILWFAPPIFLCLIAVLFWLVLRNSQGKSVNTKPNNHEDDI